jgi:hypothetical protein
MRTLLSSALALAFVGCASTSKPAVSAEQHDQNAASDEARAKQEDQRYDPDATETISRCGPTGITGVSNLDAISEGPCWSAHINPTSKHHAQAVKLRKAAAKQRAASQALRDAEAVACSGLTDADRDESPFIHAEDIAAVTTDPGNGATVVFKPLTGMTVPWLKKLIKCHTARAAALGYQVPEMSDSPLVLQGITTAVTQQSQGIAVEIRSTSKATALEIVHRAEAMRPVSETGGVSSNPSAN